MRKLLPFAILGLGLSLWLSGCGDSKSAVNQEKPASASAVAELPANLILKEAPAGAKDVMSAKKEAKDGDEVIIRGKIGGRENVFTAGRASLIIADTSMKSCDEIPGDTCPKPWDYCCEAPESLKAKTAIVEVQSVDGKLLKSNLQGVAGMDHLAIVVVKGKAKRDSAENLIVNATGIYVEKPAPKK